MIMQHYVLSVLAAVLLAAVTEKLSPAGEGGRIAAHVRFLTGLFIILSLLSPLTSAVEWITSAAEGGLSGDLTNGITRPTGTDYSEMLGDTLTSVSRAEGEAWVEKALQDRFAIPSDGCSVEVVCASDGETVRFSEIRIALTGSYALGDPHPIEAYVRESLGCPCYVTVQMP